jgi:histidine triad (HIT) family protein
MVIKDINPCAKVHMLVFPKQKNNLTGINKANKDNEVILGKLLIACKKAADLANLNEGYRIVINEGKHGCILYLINNRPNY